MQDGGYLAGWLAGLAGLAGLAKLVGLAGLAGLGGTLAARQGVVKGFQERGELVLFDRNSCPLTASQPHSLPLPLCCYTRLFQ